MKIIKGQLNENGDVILTTDVPIKMPNSSSIFKDENGIEYITISPDRIQRIQKTLDGMIEYPSKLTEIGIKYSGEKGGCHDPREIILEI